MKHGPLKTAPFGGSILWNLQNRARSVAKVADPPKDPENQVHLQMEKELVKPQGGFFGLCQKPIEMEEEFYVIEKGTKSKLYLRLAIISALGLPHVAGGDIFVRATFQGHIYETKCTNSSSPIWSEVWEIPYDHTYDSSELLIRVYSKKRFSKNILLGGAIMHFSGGLQTPQRDTLRLRGGLSSQSSSFVTVVTHVVQNLNEQPDLLLLANRLGSFGVAGGSEIEEDFSLNIELVNAKLERVVENQVVIPIVTIGSEGKIEQCLEGPPCRIQDRQIVFENCFVEHILRGIPSVMSTKQISIKLKLAPAVLLDKTETEYKKEMRAIEAKRQRRDKERNRLIERALREERVRRETAAKRGPRTFRDKNGKKTRSYIKKLARLVGGDDEDDDILQVRSEEQETNDNDDNNVQEEGRKRKLPSTNTGRKTLVASRTKKRQKQMEAILDAPSPLSPLGGPSIEELEAGYHDEENEDEVLDAGRGARKRLDKTRLRLQRTLGSLLQNRGGPRDAARRVSVVSVDDEGIDDFDLYAEEEAEGRDFYAALASVKGRKDELFDSDGDFLLQNENIMDYDEESLPTEDELRDDWEEGVYKMREELDDETTPLKLWRKRVREVEMRAGVALFPAGGWTESLDVVMEEIQKKHETWSVMCELHDGVSTRGWVHAHIDLHHVHDAPSAPANVDAEPTRSKGMREGAIVANKAPRRLFLYPYMRTMAAFAMGHKLPWHSVGDGKSMNPQLVVRAWGQTLQTPIASNEQRGVLFDPIDCLSTSQRNTHIVVEMHDHIHSFLSSSSKVRATASFHSIRTDQPLWIHMYGAPPQATNTAVAEAIARGALGPASTYAGSVCLEFASRKPALKRNWPPEHMVQRMRLSVRLFRGLYLTDPRFRNKEVIVYVRLAGVTLPTREAPRLRRSLGPTMIPNSDPHAGRPARLKNEDLTEDLLAFAGRVDAKGVLRFYAAVVPGMTRVETNFKSVLPTELEEPPMAFGQSMSTVSKPLSWKTGDTPIADQRLKFSKAVTHLVSAKQRLVMKGGAEGKDDEERLFSPCPHLVSPNERSLFDQSKLAQLNKNGKKKLEEQQRMNSPNPIKKSALKNKELNNEVQQNQTDLMVSSKGELKNVKQSSKGNSSKQNNLSQSNTYLNSSDKLVYNKTNNTKLSKKELTKLKLSNENQHTNITSKPSFKEGFSGELNMSESGKDLFESILMEDDVLRRPSTRNSLFNESPLPRGEPQRDQEQQNTNSSNNFMNYNHHSSRHTINIDPTHFAEPPSPLHNEPPTIYINPHNESIYALAASQHLPTRRRRSSLNLNDDGIPELGIYSSEGGRDRSSLMDSERVTLESRPQSIPESDDISAILDADEVEEERLFAMGGRYTSHANGGQLNRKKKEKIDFSDRFYNAQSKAGNQTAGYYIGSIRDKSSNLKAATPIRNGSHMTTQQERNNKIPAATALKTHNNTEPISRYAEYVSFGYGESSRASSDSEYGPGSRGPSVGSFEIGDLEDICSMLGGDDDDGKVKKKKFMDVSGTNNNLNISQSTAASSSPVIEGPDEGIQTSPGFLSCFSRNPPLAKLPEEEGDKQDIQRRQKRAKTLAKEKESRHIPGLYLEDVAWVQRTTREIEVLPGVEFCTLYICDVDDDETPPKLFARLPLFGGPLEIDSQEIATPAMHTCNKLGGAGLLPGDQQNEIPDLYGTLGCPGCVVNHQYPKVWPDGNPCPQWMKIYWDETMCEPTASRLPSSIAGCLLGWARLRQATPKMHYLSEEDEIEAISKEFERQMLMEMTDEERKEYGMALNGVAPLNSQEKHKMAPNISTSLALYDDNTHYDKEYSSRRMIDSRIIERVMRSIGAEEDNEYMQRDLDYRRQNPFMLGDDWDSAEVSAGLSDLKTSEGDTPDLIFKSPSRAFQDLKDIDKHSRVVALPNIADQVVRRAPPLSPDGNEVDLSWWEEPVTAGDGGYSPKRMVLELAKELAALNEQEKAENLTNDQPGQALGEGGKVDLESDILSTSDHTTAEKGVKKKSWFSNLFGGDDTSHEKNKKEFEHSMGGNSKSQEEEDKKTRERRKKRKEIILKCLAAIRRGSKARESHCFFELESDLNTHTVWFHADMLQGRNLPCHTAEELCNPLWHILVENTEIAPLHAQIPRTSNPTFLQRSAIPVKFYLPLLGRQVNPLLIPEEYREHLIPPCPVFIRVFDEDEGPAGGLLDQKNKQNDSSERLKASEVANAVTNVMMGQAIDWSSHVVDQEASFTPTLCYSNPDFALKSLNVLREPKWYILSAPHLDRGLDLVQVDTRYHWTWSSRLLGALSWSTIPPKENSVGVTALLKSLRILAPGEDSEESLELSIKSEKGAATVLRRMVRGALMAADAEALDDVVDGLRPVVVPISSGPHDKLVLFNVDLLGVRHHSGGNHLGPLMDQPGGVSLEVSTWCGAANIPMDEIDSTAAGTHELMCRLTPETGLNIAAISRLQSCWQQFAFQTATKLQVATYIPPELLSVFSPDLANSRSSLIGSSHAVSQMVSTSIKGPIRPNHDHFIIGPDRQNRAIANYKLSGMSPPVAHPNITVSVVGAAHSRDGMHVPFCSKFNGASSVGTHGRGTLAGIRTQLPITPGDQGCIVKCVAYTPDPPSTRSFNGVRVCLPAFRAPVLPYLQRSIGRKNRKTSKFDRIPTEEEIGSDFQQAAKLVLPDVTFRLKDKVGNVLMSRIFAGKDVDVSASTVALQEFIGKPSADVALERISNPILARFCKMGLDLAVPFVSKRPGGLEREVKDIYAENPLADLDNTVNTYNNPSSTAIVPYGSKLNYNNNNNDRHFSNEDDDLITPARTATKLLPPSGLVPPPAPIFSPPRRTDIQDNSMLHNAVTSPPQSPRFYSQHNPLTRIPESLKSQQQRHQTRGASQFGDEPFVYLERFTRVHGQFDPSVVTVNVDVFAEVDGLLLYDDDIQMGRVVADQMLFTIEDSIGRASPFFLNAGDYYLGNPAFITSAFSSPSLMVNPHDFGYRSLPPSSFMPADIQKANDESKRVAELKSGSDKGQILSSALNGQHPVEGGGAFDGSVLKLPVINEGEAEVTDSESNDAYSASTVSNLDGNRSDDEGLKSNLKKLRESKKHSANSDENMTDSDGKRRVNKKKRKSSSKKKSNKRSKSKSPQPSSNSVTNSSRRRRSMSPSLVGKDGELILPSQSQHINSQEEGNSCWNKVKRAALSSEPVLNVTRCLKFTQSEYNRTFMRQVGHLITPRAPESFILARLQIITTDVDDIRLQRKTSSFVTIKSLFDGQVVWRSRKANFNKPGEVMMVISCGREGRLVNVCVPSFDMRRPRENAYYVRRTITKRWRDVVEWAAQAEAERLALLKKKAVKGTAAAKEEKKRIETERHGGFLRCMKEGLIGHEQSDGLERAVHVKRGQFVMRLKRAAYHGVVDRSEVSSARAWFHAMGVKERINLKAPLVFGSEMDVRAELKGRVTAEIKHAQQVEWDLVLSKRKADMLSFVEKIKKLTTHKGLSTSALKKSHLKQTMEDIRNENESILQSFLTHTSASRREHLISVLERKANEYLPQKISSKRGLSNSNNLNNFSPHEMSKITSQHIAAAISKLRALDGEDEDARRVRSNEEKRWIYPLLSEAELEALADLTRQVRSLTTNNENDTTGTNNLQNTRRNSSNSIISYFMSNTSESFVEDESETPYDPDTDEILLDLFQSNQEAIQDNHFLGDAGIFAACTSALRRKVRRRAPNILPLDCPVENAWSTETYLINVYVLCASHLRPVKEPVNDIVGGVFGMKPDGEGKGGKFIYRKVYPHLVVRLVGGEVVGDEDNFNEPLPLLEDLRRKVVGKPILNPTYQIAALPEIEGGSTGRHPVIKVRNDGRVTTTGGIAYDETLSSVPCSKLLKPSVELSSHASLGVEIHKEDLCTLNPNFYKQIILKVRVPGPARLEYLMFDAHPTEENGQLIGACSVDLEDRILALRARERVISGQDETNGLLVSPLPPSPIEILSLRRPSKLQSATGAPTFNSVRSMIPEAEGVSSSGMPTGWLRAFVDCLPADRSLAPSSAVSFGAQATSMMPKTSSSSNQSLAGSRHLTVGGNGNSSVSLKSISALPYDEPRGLEQSGRDEDFELRIAVWDVENICIFKDTISRRNDVCIEATLRIADERGRIHLATQRTDVHKFSQDAACFNWRMIFKALKLSHVQHIALEFKILDIDLTEEQGVLIYPPEFLELDHVARVAVQRKMNGQDPLSGVPMRVVFQPPPDAKIDAGGFGACMRMSWCVIREFFCCCLDCLPGFDDELKKGSAPEEAPDYATLKKRKGSGGISGAVAIDPDLEEIDLRAAAKEEELKELEKRNNTFKARFMRRLRKSGVVENVEHTAIDHAIECERQQDTIMLGRAHERKGPPLQRPAILKTTIHFVSTELASMDPVGLAREEPNKGPFLPPPEGRIEWNMFMKRPIHFIKMLVGPDNFNFVKFCTCSIVLILFFAFLILVLTQLIAVGQAKSSTRR